MLRPAIFNDNFFDSFFDDMFAPFSNIRHMDSMRGAGAMRTDIRELTDAYEIEMELPGFARDNVKVELKRGYMTVEATRGDNNDEKDDQGKYVRRERYLGSYRRSFYVGENVTEEDIRAKFTDGILTLSVPKKENAAEIEQKKYIPIEG